MPRRAQSFQQETLTYASGGGQIEALLWRPDELTGRAPAVLFCPGATEEIPTMDFLPKAMARHGYVAMAMGYRSANWDGDDDDVSAALERLLSLPEVDANRVAIAGHFRGGLAALRTAAKDKRVKSVISLSAPVFLAQWLNGSRNFSEVIYQGMVKLLGGTPEEQADRFKDLSPLFRAAAIKQPVLLIHGTQGLYVPVEQSLWMYIALGHTGNPNVRLELPIWAGHFFDHALTGTLHDHVAELAVNWLDETLTARYA